MASTCCHILANNAVPHETLFWRAGHGWAVRKGKWKLLGYGENASKLYDLSADLGEKNDLRAAHPEVAKELRAAWNAWSAQMAKPAWPPRFRELTTNGVLNNWEL